jgi:drug/metabolite transporter (DMT)-like permease
MFSHGERKQLWITLAGLLVVLVGVAVTVTWSHFFGAIVALVGALLLGVGAFGQLRLTSHDQRRPLWIALAGGVTTAIKTKHANPRLPRTIEEQRQIIRTIAKHREL